MVSPQSCRPVSRRTTTCVRLFVSAAPLCNTSVISHHLRTPDILHIEFARSWTQQKLTSAGSERRVLRSITAVLSALLRTGDEMVVYPPRLPCLCELRWKCQMQGRLQNDMLDSGVDTNFRRDGRGVRSYSLPIYCVVVDLTRTHPSESRLRFPHLAEYPTSISALLTSSGVYPQEYTTSWKYGRHQRKARHFLASGC